jgi:hypothetical protein
MVSCEISKHATSELLIASFFRAVTVSILSVKYFLSSLIESFSNSSADLPVGAAGVFAGVVAGGGTNTVGEVGAGAGSGSKGVLDLDLDLFDGA